MLELLKLCGFTEKDIQTELPRIEKAFRKLGLKAEDIERGKQRLTTYYDIELKGLRKALRLCLLEMVKIVLAREEGKEKVIAGYMAPGFEIISAAIVSTSKNISAVHHSSILQMVLGGVFDKLSPVLEAAEQKWLKAGAISHCSNVKTIVGLIALDMIPKPDLLVSSGFLCETAPKTLDILHEIDGIPVWCFDNCQDRESAEYLEGTQRGIDFALNNERRFINRLQDFLGYEITDTMLRDAMQVRSQLGQAVRHLRELIASHDPPPLSTVNDMFISGMVMSAQTLDAIPEAIDAINTLYAELQERADKGIAVVEKGSPRIISILPPHNADPRLEHLLCELGISVVGSDFSFSMPLAWDGNHPLGKTLLQSQSSSLATITARRIPMIIEGCRKLKVAGVLGRYHSGCRIVAADAVLLKEAVERELHIPVLLMEWDAFDPRVYNDEQYRRRLEVFKTMLVKKSNETR
jgi:benzoyl-CoA reductase/2-hydroxyglutaryl-CoA dehydratase subunit BcrC/BadD/HgdB